MNCSTSHATKVRKINWYSTLVFAGFLASPIAGFAQNYNSQDHDRDQDAPPTPVQIVALDECDPKTFNDALGADFCKNVTLGAFTTLDKLFKLAKDGTPDPGWDFEPDTLRIKKGTPIIVVDQGGEPHTFTEVKQFGGGFIPDLNHGEATVPECADGFKNLAVARTRILQGSQLLVPSLSKGDHNFQCCIHPWMRVTVEVQDALHGNH
jgi:plastocyanin